MFRRSHLVASVLCVPALLAGCFNSLDKGNLKCTTQNHCPTGYSCVFGDGAASGICKQGALVVDSGGADRLVPPADAADGPDVRSGVDSSPRVDGLGPPDGTGSDAGMGGTDGANSVDAPSATGGAGAGGSGGSSAIAAGGANGVDALVTGGGGAGGTDAPMATGGTTTGSDALPLDVPADVFSPDAPGTCSTDQDCPTQKPLCLGNQCAKCASDNDCVGRTGPACSTSGLCVACTANSYCKGTAATCDTSSNQCVGCTRRSDCSGTCQTCSVNTCIAVKNQDDPTVCAGTCDATGACKGKQGQACKTSADCVNGLSCADGYCCDKACKGTCEACDVGISVGTCTTLGANATPRAGRTACVAKDPTCAGKCDGNSAACAYPLSNTSCGTASCTGTTYQPVGSCSTGTCFMPLTQSCPTNEKCSANACACQSPYQTCGSACVDTNTDGANCGICGKSCVSGSTCSAGKCQPVTMTSSLGGYSFVFWVDANYVYYNDCSTYYDCVPKRIALSAVGGSGSSLTTIDCSGYAVMGSSLLLFESQVADFLCTIGSTCQVNSSSHVPDGMPVGFKNPAPSYVAVITSSNSSTEITTWYTTTNATYSAYQNFYWSYDCAGGLSNFASVGNYQYWACGNGSGSYTIWRTNGTIPATATSQITGGFTFSPLLVDANSVSLIYLDTNNLYRVPAPGGLGTGAPQLIVSGTGTKFVTEDANGIYWIDTLANLNRCTASSCSSTTTVMTTGQTLGNYFTGNGNLGVLYQDSGFLYWINGSGQLMKLAK